MIYFDKDKQAFAYEIPEYICTVEDNVWDEYAGTDKWDIINGVFTDITNTPEYVAEKLQEAKQAKYTEALEKAYKHQQNGTVEYKNCIFEMSDSNRKNLSDTEEALKLQGLEETTWLDKDDNYVTLTVNDIQYIRLNLILAAIQKLWIKDYPAYKQRIAEAKTIDSVNKIVIHYEV